MTSPPGGESEYIADREQAMYEERVREIQEEHPDSPLHLLFGALASHVQADKKADEYGQRRAEELAEEQELRARPGPLGGTNYLSYEHKELDRFVREDFNPGAVHDIGRVYHDHGAKLRDFSDRIRQAATKTEENWQGEAGDAMRAHVTNVADHMGHSGKAAQLTANQVGMQAEAGERARNAMPEVVEFDLQQEMKGLAAEQNPVLMIARVGQMVQKHEESRAAHQEAAQVLTTMENDFGTAAEQTPTFLPAPKDPDQAQELSRLKPTTTLSAFQEPATPMQTRSALAEGTPAAGGHGPGAAVPGALPGSVPPGSVPPGSAPGSTPPASVTPSSYTPGSVQPSSPGTAPGQGGGGGTPQYRVPDVPSYTTGPKSTTSQWDSRHGGGTGGGDTRWNPRTNTWEKRNPYNGNWAPIPGGYRPGGRDGSGPSGGRGPGGFGPNGPNVPGVPNPGTPGGGAGRGFGGAGGLGAAGGAGGLGAAGGAGGAGTSAQPGPGGRAGVGGVPGTPGGAAVTGGAVAGGRGGAGMAGAAGGAPTGRGQGGDDDLDHQNKYLQENDDAWRDLGLPPVAPPVFE
ncbi:hypothetical protein [Saccharopolyspora cebuensis]|uniref:PPE family protein n=1 Tax=Saccharopolyspora cebuensis TaxID=418759 RepID=A0ABV4CLJ4_9PSEU